MLPYFDAEVIADYPNGIAQVMVKFSHIPSRVYSHGINSHRVNNAHGVGRDKVWMLLH